MKYMSQKEMKNDQWLSDLFNNIFNELGEEEVIKFSLDFHGLYPIRVDIGTLRPIIEINRLQKLIACQIKSDYSDKEYVIKVLKLCIDCWKHQNSTDLSAARLMIDSTRSLAIKSAESMMGSGSSTHESVMLARPSWSARSALDSAWISLQLGSITGSESPEELAVQSIMGLSSKPLSAKSAAWSGEAEFLIKTLRDAK